MSLGIFISALNAIHFRKLYNFLFEFIPQVLFLGCTFGYMCFLIIYKWCINWPLTTSYPLGPPNLLNVMINMFESPGRTGNYTLYEDQEYIELAFLLTALLSVPIMLFVKPYLIKRDHEAQERYRLLNSNENEEEVVTPSASGGGHGEHGEEWDFSEIMVHQIIHTIEFVLGAVSNTASYLRLWALSLAHSELSSVFMSMVMLASLSMNNLGYFQVVAIIVGFAAWAFLNFAVLLMMESLSAFLHALRLHWVEFQNKFYLGDGYKFIPFSYEIILAETS